mgnify:CR=1 FL=1
MPNQWFQTDSLMPSFNGNETNRERIDKMWNVMYQVLEQMRYFMYNIGTENFNSAELEKLETIINAPIYAAMTDADGNTGNYSLTAEGMTAWLSNKFGELAALAVTAAGLTSAVYNSDGSSKITQNAEAIASIVQGGGGDVSSLIRQAMDSITLSVTDNSANGGTSYLKLNADSITEKSTQINLTGDVTFSSLRDSSSTTTINGAEITTGTINAMDLNIFLDGDAAYGNNATETASTSEVNFKVTYTYGGQQVTRDAGSLYIYKDPTVVSGNSPFGIMLKTKSITYQDSLGQPHAWPFVLKLDSDTNISVEAGSDIYITAPTIHLGDSSSTVYIKDVLQ